jgi:hypothetical protein
MNHDAMLTRLIAQAATEGSELITLRAIVEEASEMGAGRVLERIGLGDSRAQDDIDELRELLAAWRAAKASAWQAAVTWIVRGAMALLLIGIALETGFFGRLGLPGMLK